jgi:predicted DsbA family dithiol-disulfide isomerase
VNRQAACGHGGRDLEAFPHRGAATIEWRSFELGPAAPRKLTEPLNEHLAAKTSRPLDEVDQLQSEIQRRGREYGIDFRFDLAGPRTASRPRR